MSTAGLPKPGTIEISPSILSADFANLRSEIAQVVDAGVNMIHLDVMDGHFVQNITLGPPVVKWIRKCTDAFLDCHLMITDPLKYAESFVKAGVDHITFHIETADDPIGFVEYLRRLGVTIGVTLKPETPVSAIEQVAPLCDMVLVMTVEPGFGGQAFMDDAARKCMAIRQLVGSNVRIEVDGGIDSTTAAKAIEYGADTLVVGSAIFSAPDRQKAIEAIKATFP